MRAERKKERLLANESLPWKKKKLPSRKKKAFVIEKQKKAYRREEKRTLHQGIGIGKERTGKSKPARLLEGW